MTSRSSALPRPESAQAPARPRRWVRLRSGRLLAGLVLAALYLVLILLGPALVARDPLEQNLGMALLPPGPGAPLGTDEFGRDLLSRLVYGGRLSLQIALGATLAPVVLGTLIGLVAGYFGGLVDLLVMRLLELLMAFPGYILALLVVAALGPGTGNMLIAIAIYLLPRFALVSRRATFVVATSDYVAAARLLGFRTRRILLAHVLPNCLTPLIAEISTALGAVILVASGLSFLGLGPQRPAPEWGLMLSDARQYLWSAPHLALAPGLAIFGLVLAFNLLGDGLRDVLSPNG